ncbi:GTP-binding protein Rho1 [Serendipita sp. 396]|nr:GTP-binding protein Rho1 [Serendipita sp. 396]KAG8786951.1 GTP-binding protein Rho1 [Serendipita sp. 397]KAG8802182.1 GTP-binding protein Rho1 [Serendipita sp. 398]KAG8871288.1 GTP-binding protein Rho1 [Serendipita sp. 405]
MEYEYRQNDVDTSIWQARRVRIALIGGPQMGKKYLLQRILMGIYKEIPYDPTGPVEDYIYRKINMELLGKMLLLDLCIVTIYNEYFWELSRCIKDASLIIVCFGIEDHASLESVERVWSRRSEIRQLHPDVPVLLLGCKMDSRCKEKIIGERRLEPVSHKQGTEVAQRIRASMYLECSAKTGQGVNEAFYHAARLSFRGKRHTIIT